MTAQPDLFGGRSADDRYPSAPGYKIAGTSKDAAHAIAPRANTLRAAVLRRLLRSPATADECATSLAESVLSIRPRLSELREAAAIEDTGERRKNQSGRPAAVWRITAIGRASVSE